MKSSEFHRMVKNNGWKHIRTDGQSKDGRIYPVPFHGTKEVFEPLRKKMIKELGLK